MRWRLYTACWLTSFSHVQWQNAEVIGHSLDGIAGLIDDLCAGKMPEQRVLEDARREMQENAEAIESIILCASHQGRIADGELVSSSGRAVY